MRAQRIQRGNWVYRQNRQGFLFIKRETFIFGAFSNKGPCFNKAVNIKRENRRQRRPVHINSDPESHQINPPDGIHRSTSSSLLCSFTSSRFLQVISLSLPPPPCSPSCTLFVFESCCCRFPKKSGKPTQQCSTCFFCKTQFFTVQSHPSVFGSSCLDLSQKS